MKSVYLMNLELVGELKAHRRDYVRWLGGTVFLLKLLPLQSGPA